MRYRATVFGVLALFVIVLAACGGGGTSSTTAPSGGDSGTSGGASGTPEAAALSFISTLLSGGDVSALVCGSAGDALTSYSEQMEQAMSAFAAAGGEVSIDTAGLSAAAANADADSADVTVSGSYSVSVSIAGQATSQSAEFAATTFQMVAEGGAWKVCGLGVG